MCSFFFFFQVRGSAFIQSYMKQMQANKGNGNEGNGNKGGNGNDGPPQLLQTFSESSLQAIQRRFGRKSGSRRQL